MNLVTRGLGGSGQLLPSAGLANVVRTPEILRPPEGLPPTGGRDTGPVYRPRRGRRIYDPREAAIEETRRQLILKEDDDIVALITAMLTEGLM